MNKIDKTRISRAFKLFLCSSAFLAASFCRWQIADLGLFCAPNLPVELFIYRTKLLQRTSMLLFTLGTTLWVFPFLLIFKKTEKDEEKEINENQEMDEE